MLRQLGSDPFPYCLIGGFAILEADSMEKAVELTRRFLRLHGNEWDIECEVRQMEGPDFGLEP